MIKSNDSLKLKGNVMNKQITSYQKQIDKITENGKKAVILRYIYWAIIVFGILSIVYRVTK
ncbi:unknown [Phascolarctobacterium sp. CAG:266]|nr:unknown [Phascolarctobacterium sp. CAG:266]